MSGIIFISYRRGDGGGFAGRLYDRLETEFSRERIFFDIDTIPPGADFVELLTEKVEASDVLVAVIGRAWSAITDDKGKRRLDNPDDFVRIELARGLASGKRIIPVLVDGATMPSAEELPDELKPLTRRNAIRLSHETFRADCDRIVRALRDASTTAVERSGSPNPPAGETASSTRPAATVAFPTPPGPENQPARTAPRSGRYAVRLPVIGLGNSPLARRLVLSAALLFCVLAAGGWFVTAPNPLAADEIPAVVDGAAARGERIFWAGGCSSCHARPKSEGDARLQLAGGLELNTPFGTFVAPNISSDPEDGIGGWSIEDFANAMLRGVSPAGSHYYPAFPYSSYARMEPSDVADLYAFMKTLPAVEGQAPAHRLGFPFNIRRGIGLWKLLNLSPEPVVALASGAGEAVRRGRYLVEGPGHCGECHTPRDFMGGLRKAEWLSGAVAAEGRGTVPNITPGDDGIGSWSEGEIVEFLTTGFTPEFDSAGGAMADVVSNMAMLPEGDRAAIAAYLKAVPALPDGHPPRN